MSCVTIYIVVSSAFIAVHMFMVSRLLTSDSVFFCLRLLLSASSSLCVCFSPRLLPSASASLRVCFSPRLLLSHHASLELILAGEFSHRHVISRYQKNHCITARTPGMERPMTHEGHMVVVQLVSTG